VALPTMAVLIVAGNQVPVIPSADRTGSAGGIEFWYNVPMGVKTGVIRVVVMMSIVTRVGHWSAEGEKV